ncbi:hypothetical protein BDV97DRAFT_364122 [Delphinella strobiligena]|nr:hypothetical protein BDV97DRAFT_364122 [Delphinella strobiligena]
MVVASYLPLGIIPSSFSATTPCAYALLDIWMITPAVSITIVWDIFRRLNHHRTLGRSLRFVPCSNIPAHILITIALWLIEDLIFEVWVNSLAGLTGDLNHRLALDRSLRFVTCSNIIARSCVNTKARWAMPG